MKFTRRPDLEPRTRIYIVMLAWLHQGVYGKMTAIAKGYQISRGLSSINSFLWPTCRLETLFSDEKLLFQKDHRHFEQLILLLRLEGTCLLPSIAAIVKALEYHPNSVGSLSQCFHSAGHALPSTLVMPSKTLVFSLSDELFAIHAPILVTIDARSTTILKIELASDRSADTWRAHFAALENHQFVSLGLASDRGLGLVAGYRAACDMALWVADYFHEFRDLFAVLHQVERQAYTAIEKEYDAMQKFARAKSEANLHKRLHHYDTAHHACEQAVALYDHLAMLLHLLREALQLCSPHGRLRTQQDVRSELTLLFDMLAELDCAAVTTTLKPIRMHLDDLVVPFAQAEAIDAELRASVPHEACEFLVLAWHHEHLSYELLHSPSAIITENASGGWHVPKGSLATSLTPSKRWCSTSSTRLSGPPRSSRWSIRLFRPDLNSCKGQIPQATLNLIMFYHNHWRYKSGKRQGKAPIELLTGKPLEAPWWELLLQQVTPTPGVPGHGIPLASSPLQLVVNNAGRMHWQTMTPGRALAEPPCASENNRRQQDSAAA